MPSRSGVALIVLFWAATVGFVAYRDVWPRYFSDGPPPLRIDLADEASSQVPAKWSLFRRTPEGKDEKVGGLTTYMQYVARDDTFWFRSEYRDLKFHFGTVTLSLPKADTAVRVTRTGRLREHELDGKVNVVVGAGTLSAEAALAAEVVEGVLVGHAKITHPFGTIDRPLDPVPVPDGQVLNPMMPVGRLRDVRPGRRWVIRQVDPLKDAVQLLVKEAAKGAPLPLGLPAGGDDGEELVASVRSEPEAIRPYRAPQQPPADPVDCWVIDYAGRDTTATTWVSVADGKVLRQEAAGFGERVRFEREY